ncbi:MULTISPECIES: hypothetical protein [Synechocystis]|uniref:Uncharacterized protein n=1 Tax=Synechocystis salina LEGE 00031 TaxID=1828736 RepID=A0ABR9VWM2_9SYNC|nr:MULTISPECIES: hypothetical protein [Synechocystis]MBE9197061.1 hypothetical protein [Synechocystis sp. LEGE 06083]MBE9242907.1 hypothetical protein [Synechocystis salina LEGE 00041]MBE9255780.1 hypothetical protein [Synechocystis salina LEGE 00031]
MANKVAKAKHRSKSNFGDFVFSPLALFLAVVACMGGTAFISYKLGDAALEGVVQPPSNPMEQFVIPPTDGEKAKDESDSGAKFKPVNIQQVAKETRGYIKKQQKMPKGEANSTNADQAETDTEKKS